MKTEFSLEPLLALAPHTDDAELGCGGALARLIEEGREVHIAVFSTAEESRPEGAPEGLLKEEFYRAMKTLDIPQEQLNVYDYPVRRLSYYRQEVLEELVKLRKKIQPKAVFAPAGTDLHQDHQVVFAEGLRAFKDMTFWGYELPWNHVEFAAQAFITLEQRHLDAKWNALQSYRSQLELKRPYFSQDFLMGLARVRGTQVRAEFAEAFQVVRICL